MFAPSNPARLAELLRGEGTPKSEQRARAHAEDAVVPRGGLPRALTLWQAQQAAREADALRLVTTPRPLIESELEHTPERPDSGAQAEGA
jgi:hypothetical protein